MSYFKQRLYVQLVVELAEGTLSIQLKEEVRETERHIQEQNVDL